MNFEKYFPKTIGCPQIPMGKCLRHFGIPPFVAVSLLLLLPTKHTLVFLNILKQNRSYFAK